MKYLDDALLLVGYALIVLGVSLQFGIAVGCIVAGFCFASLAYLVAKR
jgi:hypothetical protein